jgi:hypothetical protein
MSTPINGIKQVQAVQNLAPVAVASQKASVPKTQGLPADSVTISSSAKAILQEVSETRAQTQLEANGGDIQARRLLAREAASNPAPKG